MQHNSHHASTQQSRRPALDKRRRGYDVVPMDLPFDRVWLPYIYLYGVGGFCFFSGILLVLKSGALDWKRRSHRRWLGVLLFGFCWYAAIHGLGTLAAINL